MAKLDLYSGLPAASNPMESATVNALNKWKADLGDKFPAQKAALDIALTVIATGLASAITDKSKQLAKMALNKAFLAGSSIQVPSIKPPDLSGAIQSVFTSLKGINTGDTTKISQGAQNANNVRGPEGLNEFLKKSMDQKEKNTQTQITDMKDQLKTVNGLKNQLNSM